MLPSTWMGSRSQLVRLTLNTALSGHVSATRDGAPVWQNRVFRYAIKRYKTRRLCGGKWEQRGRFRPYLSAYSKKRIWRGALNKMGRQHGWRHVRPCAAPTPLDLDAVRTFRRPPIPRWRRRCARRAATTVLPSPATYPPSRLDSPNAPGFMPQQLDSIFSSLRIGYQAQRLFHCAHRAGALSGGAGQLPVFLPR